MKLDDFDMSAAGLSNVYLNDLIAMSAFKAFINQAFWLVWCA